MNNQDREPNNWCEVPGQKCYMNYCDENGCLDRKRNYTPFGLSLLRDEDLQNHVVEQEFGSDQYVLAVQELLKRGLVPV